LGKSITKWRGKWALVTGASAGIGKALAQELAAGGTNLVLTARRRERLEDLARTVSAAHRIKVETFVADLADPAGPETILVFTREKSIHIDLLINNAGFGAYGEFATSDRSRQLEMVQVNCAAVVNLTHLFLPAMIECRSGDILILASTASFQAVPYISTYAATKAFDLSFAEGLAEELKPHGIRVCALCPGSTESEFHQIASQANIPAANRRRESSEKVAKTGLKALAAGRSYVISGAGNYLGAQVQRLVPRRVVTSIAAKLFRPSTSKSFR
jgi:short-subunit dehydrogenase